MPPVYTPRAYPKYNLPIEKKISSPVLHDAGAKLFEKRDTPHQGVKSKGNYPITPPHPNPVHSRNPVWRLAGD